MNVLILNHEFPPVGGGAANATAYIARELSSLGVKVTVMTSSYNNLPKYEVQDGFSVVRVPTWRKEKLESHPHELLSYLVSGFWKSLPLCRYSGPNLIHAFFGLPSGLLASAISQLTGLPYLISFRGRDVHGGRGELSNGIKGPIRIISRVIWRQANSLVANSQGLKRIAHCVDPDIPVQVIPNGIDTARFIPVPPPNSDLPIKILFVGRLECYKGLKDLIQALGVVKKIKKIPFTLQIVGDGSLRNSLPDEASLSGIANRVNFSGIVSGKKMPQIYQNADLFVLPSTVEGMPNVVLEAMASGLPVLATKIPGSEELVRQGQTGLLVPPSSPNALVEALCYLIENPDIRTTMGKLGRSDMETRSWSQIAKTYLALYQKILKGN